MKRRLRVLHLVYSLGTGGLENGVVNLCNRLAPDEFAPSIGVFQSGGALEARLDRDRVELFLAKAHFGIDPTLPPRLAWQLWRRRIDVLHTHSWGTLVEGMLAAKFARTPVVIHGEHGVLEERPRNIPIQRWLWSQADQVAAVAASVADRMANVIRFPRSRIQVIPNGVDTLRFRPFGEGRDRWRAQFGLPAAGFLIGMVARLVPVKNHLGMFRALARLREGGTDAHLALAGDGPLIEELRQAARDLQIEEQVHFLGNVAKVEQLLSALDVFVLNSHSEGMSNTILEAMACGIPVVATSVGENAMLVSEGQTGYLTPVDHVGALSQSLELLARAPARRAAMAMVARLRIEQSFGMDQMVRAYSDLYRKFGRNAQVLPEAEEPLHSQRQQTALTDR